MRSLPAIFIAYSFVAYASGSGCSLVSAAEKTPDSLVSEHIEAGRKIYNFRCYFCHGYSGNAQTVAASLLSPPPVDFTRADASLFTPEHVVSVLRKGKPGTAMKSFRGVISDIEIAQVAEFVVDEFVRRKASNTRYHTTENGWPNHERYQSAFPFATGEIPASQPWESLTPDQTRGKHLFMSSCVICHDRGESQVETIIWETRPLSYPRNNYSHTIPPDIDAMASASPYRIHDMPPPLAQNMSALELRGQKLFQDNCAFCHGADGTGKNWIGSFLESHPRNLRDPEFMAGMTRSRLAATVRDGLPNTSMPAWKSVFNSDDIDAVVAYISIAFHALPD